MSQWECCEGERVEVVDEARKLGVRAGREAGERCCWTKFASSQPLGPRRSAARIRNVGSMPL